MRVKGITKRWIFNVLGLLIGVVLAVELAFGFFVYNTYYESAKSAVYQKSIQSGNYSELISASDADYGIRALNFVENFQYKEEIEVHVLDKSGKVIVTSSGFTPTEQEMPDYSAAQSAENRRGEWMGRNSAGEKVFTFTLILANSPNGGQSMGAVRYLISMEKVDQQILINILILLAVGVAILFFSFISGIYFISSIVKPIRAVSATARKIALGNFDSRIEVNETDEIGELCDTINYMASELNAAENMKNEFISSVSHELRTPLTAIKGWSETVVSAAEQDPEIMKKGLRVITDEAERLSGLVEELLDFSRMQSGRMSFRMERTDILAELGEAVYMYEAAAKRAGIELFYEEPATMPPVIGDGNRLKQVFINVLDNAVKYTEKGGKVIVKAEFQENCIVTEISDTGCGIPERDLGRVKEKFYKANKMVRGSGIGLAVAEEIVKKHGGLLLIESKLNVGTNVKIVLPVETDNLSEQ